MSVLQYLQEHETQDIDITVVALQCIGYVVRRWSDFYRVGQLEFYWDTEASRVVVYDHSSKQNAVRVRSAK